MKQLFGFFLFQKRPGDELSRKKRVIFWLWNAFLLAGAAIALGLISLALAPAQYGWTIFWDYLTHPALLALNLLPPAALMALLYGLTGRAWLAYVITALPVLGLSVGNYYKLAFRDDPVIASDLLILGEAGKMAENYQLYPTVRIVAAILLAILSAVLLFLFARGCPRWPRRGITAAAAAAAIAILIPVYASDSVYNANANTNFEHLNQWSSTQQYISRGLLYPFLHSIKGALPSPPEGYSEREAAALLAQYDDEAIPEDKKVNIVGIMLEAFADFSVFDQIQFNQDVYSVLHALEAEGYSGNLVTNIFAGGTVDTERAFLTGMAPSDPNFRANTSSYVWYLKSQGYRTSGDHPSLAWFYNRQNINEFLGFDSYRFMENYYDQFTDGSSAYDGVFIPELTASILEQLESDAPLFSFSVSYQGHGPYASDACVWGEVDDYFANYELDQASRTILANYFIWQINTQNHLTKMVDTFRASDEPIVLVLFGDHKPWLGNNNSVYTALGIDLSCNDKESFYNYASTRYLIWANDAAKEVIGHDMAGVGPDVSPCFLMNVLFEQLGWKGDAYMQAVDECWRGVPVIHSSGLHVTADGVLRATRWLEEDQAALVQRFRNLEYYRLRHYSP